MTTIGIFGAGAVGMRVARHLAMGGVADQLVIGCKRPARLKSVVEQFDVDVRLVEPGPMPSVDVAVLSLPSGSHAALAEDAMARGAHVVSISDSVGDVEALLSLDAAAAKAGRSIVVGAAYSPGLSCLLAKHVGALFDVVEEIHIARSGTGGPACAQQLHKARTGASLDWWDQAWRRRPGGSGRELVWFPDAMGARDCYRGALPDALLLASEFAEVDRITARVAGTRRDRLTAMLPMLRRPHQDGGPGGIRVEVRGRRGSSRRTEVLGVLDDPSAAAAAVAAVAAERLVGGTEPTGAWGLARVDDTVPWLSSLAARGVRAAAYEGVDQAS
jgi:hypothetical protein